MTVQHFQAPDAPGFKLDTRVVAAFGRFAGGFWQGRTAFGAWALTLGLAAFLIMSTGATVALNYWNRWFFNSLEARDAQSLWQSVLVLALITVAVAASVFGATAAYNLTDTRVAEFGSANHRFENAVARPEDIAPYVAEAKEWFDTTEVTERNTSTRSTASMPSDCSDSRSSSSLFSSSLRK